MTQVRFQTASGAVGGAPRRRIFAMAALLVIASTQLCAGTPPPKLEGVLTFRLTMAELEPSVITVPEGRYLIRLVNRLVVGEISMQLEDAGKSSMMNKALRRGSSGATQIVDLQPGRYTLRVPGKAGWSATINVAKKGK